MKRKRKKQNIQKSYICKIFGLIVAITVIAVSGGVLLKRTITESPEDTLVEYMNHTNWFTFLATPTLPEHTIV